MKRYLLDTNTVSYFIRGVDTRLTERVGREMLAQTAAISVITRAELRFGQAALAPDDRRRRAVDLCLNQLMVLPWTSAAADIFGTVKNQLKRKGLPIGDMDTLIAAHALAEKLILVTHNTRHFENIADLALEDWMV